MNTSRGDAERAALTAARQVRVRAGVSAEQSICIYDLVDQCFGQEIELRFLAAPSLEGIYVRGEPENGRTAIIVLSALRPSGRQRQTCAHELGHHIFGHGNSLDEIQEPGRGRTSPEERVADSFGQFLTMPKLGVMKAFADRNVRLLDASPTTVFAVASQFGVGYSTLIRHMSSTLGLLNQGAAEALLKVQPRSIREQLLGRAVPGDLLLVDRHWVGRAADLAVGDHILLPRGTNLIGISMKFVEARNALDVYEAVTPGVARATNDAFGLALYVRVARAQYEGRSIFRHLEESDESD